MGQMVRGGRSCPPEWKLGGGACKSGKDAAAGSSGSKSVGMRVSMEANEPQAVHMPHLCAALPLLCWVPVDCSRAPSEPSVFRP